jgi:thiol-disulfide isomerase/thioredoxin
MVAIQITALVLAATGAGETVLYDFQASWCGPCKMMAPVVQQLADEGYPVRKVDVDQEAALARRYGVTNIPCFVLIVNGQEQGRVIGAASYQRLAGLLAEGGVSRAGAEVVNARAQSPDRPKKLLPLAGSLFRKSAAAPAEIPVPRVELGVPTATPPVAVSPVASESRVAVDQTFSRAQPSSPNGGTEDPGNGMVTTDPLIEHLLRASVRLKVHDPKGYSFGSGTIIDFRPHATGNGGDALILTCGHIFRDSRGKGEIEVALFDSGTVKSVPAELIRYDLQRDIGLVSIRTKHRLPVVPLAAEESVQTKGSPVLSIGCNHGHEPTIQKSTIKAINSFVGPPNLQVAGQPAIGRSGGGLFNIKGELIGVCNFADPTDRAGLYAAVKLAHAVLQQSSGLLASPVGSPRPGPPPRANADLVALADTDRPINSPSELICIVRSGSGSQSRHQVIVIDNASSELLDQIVAARTRSQRAFPTSMALGADNQRRGVTILPAADGSNRPTRR